MSEGQQASVAMAFIGQSAVDIRKKLQRMEGLQDMTIQDLVKEANKVYNKRETQEEKEERREREKEEKERQKEKERDEREEKRDRKRNRELTKILSAVVEKASTGTKGSNRRAPGARSRPSLGSNQCAYCKEEGHWAKNCPKLRKKRAQDKGPGKSLDLLALTDED